MIYKINTYTDKEGKTLISTEAIDGSSTDFFGNVVIQTPNGNIPIEFPFTKATSVEECFENYDDVLKQFIEDKKREASEQSKVDQIITPDNKIITP